jgi:RNA polymerase sigma factor (TIGR02999 family)
MTTVTYLPEAAPRGNRPAPGDLLPLVYGELRRLAAHKMASLLPGHTLQPTALVHEAWLRLAGSDREAQFRDRTHFFAAAAEAMRHILIDHARRKRAARHGGGQLRVGADDLDLAVQTPDDELLAVNDALDQLAEVDAAKAELVKLRYFAGMTLQEAAQALGISEPTAKRRWALARAWLFNAIRGENR